MSLSAGARLGAYEIISPLGAGGMGEVYRARDKKLARDVAIKVLPPDVARDPERLARFQREARAAAALNHPHIVTVHTVEEDGGVHFLTMELIEGQGLDRLIPPEGLPIEQVVVIAAALADALAAAHDKGIVHRDLKPGNVMVSGDGRVKVLDFGLAKALAPEGASVTADYTLTSAGRTEVGAVLGTPAYMSPEQIEGRAVDHRSDLFSLGVVVYEMATGQRPFQSDNHAGLISSILRDTPPPASSVRRGLPEGIQRIIERCLQKDPHARPANARELKSSLSTAGSGRASPSDEQSVAVLPFKSLSADPNDEFLADGVTEEILNALAQIPDLKVTGRSSAFSFKGRSEDLRSVGAKLGVSTILEGTLRRSGDRLRITAQLISAASGYQLWSERYDRVMEDVFAVQDEIATTIAQRLRVSLGSSRDGQSAQRPTKDLAAYELYLKGRGLLYQRGLSILRAIECLTQAVALDPEYAQAWAGLADGYTASGYSGFRRPDEVMPRALDAARRALALDPNLAEAHNAFACASLLYERDYDLGEREFKRAIELNPNYQQARAWYGLFSLQWIGGREKEGQEQIKRMLEIDPHSGYANVIRSFSAYFSGHVDEGVAFGRVGIEIDPGSYLGHWTLMEALHYAGRHEEAAAVAERALAISGRHTWALTTLTMIYTAWGRTDEARAAFQELQSRAARQYVQPSMLCAAAAAVVGNDAGVALARQALEIRDPLFTLLARGWPGYDRLRTDPRFLDIVGELRLPNWKVISR